MRLAVIGAGAVGSVVGGLLARAGEDVTLIGRRSHAEAVNENGLCIDGALGELRIRVTAAEQLDHEPEDGITFWRQRENFAPTSTRVPS